MDSLSQIVFTALSTGAAAWLGVRSHISQKRWEKKEVAYAEVIKALVEVSHHYDRQSNRYCASRPTVGCPRLRRFAGSPHLHSPTTLCDGDSEVAASECSGKRGHAQARCLFQRVGAVGEAKESVATPTHNFLRLALNWRQCFPISNLNHLRAARMQRGERLVSLVTARPFFSQVTPASHP